MKSVALTAHPRTLTRGLGTKKIRAQGRIPGVIYGRGIQPQNLEVDRKDLENLMHHSVSETRLVDLSITGDSRTKRLALLQQVQHHPLTGAVLHIDLREVSDQEKVVVYLPVETSGEAVGVKTGGGILEHVLFRVRVRALPKDLPEFIQIDVAHMEVGNTIHIGDIKLAAGVEILGDKNIPVVSVAIPRQVVEEEPAAGAAATPAGEVEMIKEKKDDKGAKPEAGAKGEAKGEAKGDAKAAAKPDAKAGAKPEAKPDAKAGDKGGGKK